MKFNKIFKTGLINFSQRQSPLKVIVLFAGMAGEVYAFSRLILRQSGSYLFSIDTIVYVFLFACLSILLFCSVFFFFIGNNPLGFRIGLGIKLVALFFYLVVAPVSIELELLLLSGVLLEIAIYEAYFLNLVISVGFLGITSVNRVIKIITFRVNNSPYPAVEYDSILAQISFSFLLLLLSIFACLLIHYREKCADQNEQMSRLDNALSKIAKSNLGYQNYANEASMRSELEERQRITREIHDIIGYTFTNNIMMLEAAISKIRKDPEKVQQLISLARENATTGLEKIRNSLYHLRAADPIQLTSIDRFHKLIGIFQIATDIEVVEEYGNSPNQFGDEIESFIYYFIQETLTNAFRHGEATRIRVRFFHAERGLIISVLDNGRGASDIKEGIGIAGMKERLAGLGGILKVARRSPGFELLAEIPLQKEGSDVYR